VIGNDRSRHAVPPPDDRRERRIGVKDGQFKVLVELCTSIDRCNFRHKNQRRTPIMNGRLGGERPTPGKHALPWSYTGFARGLKFLRLPRLGVQTVSHDGSGFRVFANLIEAERRQHRSSGCGTSLPVLSS
jgi:hypothetical protein